MAIDPNLQQKLLGIFRTDLEEQLQVITDNLLKLETEPQIPVRLDIFDAMMRAAHSLKGGAHGIGVSNIGDIMHNLETLFVALKTRDTEHADNVVELCLSAVDHVKMAMVAFDEGGDLPFDMAALIQKLVDESSQNSKSEKSSEKAPSKPKTKPRKKTPPKIKKIEPKGEPTEAVPISNKGEIDGAAIQKKAPPAEIKNKAKPVRHIRDDQEFIRVPVGRVETVSALLEEMQESKIELDDHLAAVHQMRRDMENSLLAWNEVISPVTVSGQIGFDEYRQKVEHASAGFNDLGVTVMNVHRDIRVKNNRLGMTLLSLQNEIRMMRLVPANTVLAGLARTVRDISRELGKKVQFEMVGAETEMDQPILETISAPLVHLVRNAIDHGLETPEIRTKNGKPEKGKITLSIIPEGAEIAIEVKDDGGGIDKKKIAEKAVKVNLVTQEKIKSFSELELINLIFKPGFSTKDEVTEVSGRGVGMDVVRSNLQGIKGEIQVKSVLGKGSTFTLRVPLTLATEQGLIVKTAGQMFAIPITSVERVMSLLREDVINVETGQAVMVNEQPVPLRYLSDALELDGTRTTQSDTINVVVLGLGWKMVAIVVEEIVGQQEMVIKPLKAPLVSVNNVSGGTLTGKGKIVIVLNANELVETLLKDTQTVQVFAHDLEEEITAKKVLVVDDTLTTRALEKNILEGEGYIVTTAVNGQEAWEILRNQLFDLVVTDVQMPYMDGFELADRIKKSDVHKHIPVIIVTSLASEDDQRRGIEVGADAYIVKSHFETRELVNVAEQLT